VFKREFRKEKKNVSVLRRDLKGDADFSNLDLLRLGVPQ